MLAIPAFHGSAESERRCQKVVVGSRLSVVSGRGRCEERSQSAPGRGPALKAPTGREFCETNPIEGVSSEEDRLVDQFCETKPISPGDAKGQVLCRKRVMTDFASKRASEKQGQNAVGGGQLSVGGVNGVKQGQLGGVSNGRGKYEERSQSPAGRSGDRQSRGTNARNEPNFATRHGGATALPERSYDALDRQTGSEEQSQKAVVGRP